MPLRGLGFLETGLMVSCFGFRGVWGLGFNISGFRA